MRIFYGAGRGTLTPDRFAVNRWPIIISDESGA